jgi:hypothetical protein
MPKKKKKEKKEEKEKNEKKKKKWKQEYILAVYCVLNLITMFYFQNFQKKTRIKIRL